MRFRRINRIVEKNRNEVIGLLLHRYPPFVWSSRAQHTSTPPTFVFHAVTAGEFEPLLRYLSENGYRTLTADEYLQRQRGGSRGRAREALLTLDDGHKSLYTVAYPALKRYGHKAVAYIVPGMTLNEDDAGDVCNWREISEMHSSGAVDFQSHSMYHHSIAVSSKVVDFVRPGLELSFMKTDLVPLAGEAALGTPVHSWGARFGRLPAFRESGAVTEACVERVRGYGGADYFNRPDWRAELMEIAERARRNSPPSGFESAAEQQKAILHDLVQSKRVIESRLPGKEVRHYCFPWFRGSPLAARLAGEAGYMTAAWGSLLPRFADSGALPVPIPRLPSLYIYRLPGAGRWPVRTLLRNRLGGMFKNGQGNLYI